MIWEIHYCITKLKTKIDVIPRSCFKFAGLILGHYCVNLFLLARRIPGELETNLYKHLYTIYTMLVQRRRCLNVIRMF